jgi:hypothetical protein
MAFHVLLIENCLLTAEKEDKSQAKDPAREAEMYLSRYNGGSARPQH